MERLTTRNSISIAVLKDPYECDCCGNVISRLADYGNGEPIEKLCRYEELQDRLDKEFKGCINMETIISSFIEFYDQEEKAEELAECLLIVNDNVRRYRKWEKLDKQGRLLELPCEPGSEIWCIDKSEGIPEIVRGVVDGYLWYRTCGFALDVVWNRPIMGNFIYTRKEMPFLDIGKIAFLSREKAEEALKRMEDWK